MKKFLAMTLTAVLAAGVLAGCGSSDSGDANGGNANGGDSTDTTYSWKMALNSTEGDNAYDMGAAFKEKIEEISGGQITVELYGGGSLGTTSEVLEGMSYGVADLMVESIGTLSTFSPLANIDAMPYVYSGYDHFMSVWNSELGDEMKTTIGEAAGFKLLGATFRGPRIVSATKEMSTVDDFKGFKLRAPNLEIYLETWNWMGAAPTPIAVTETYTALQQGTVEGQENPMADSLNYAFDEVCKYWIKTNHVYSANVVIMDDDYFNSLPAEIQAMVEEAADYASQTISESQLDKEAAAEAELIEKGCTVIEVDQDAFAAHFDGFAEEKFPDLADWVNRIKEADTAA